MPHANDIMMIDGRDPYRALSNGLKCRCPRCGEGRLFARYISVVPRCAECGEDLSHQRADDAPPYVVIFIVGHVLVGLALWAEKMFHPPLWIHFVVWLPATVALALLLLPPIKGMVVALQWANRMHGFGAHEEL